MSITRKCNATTPAKQYCYTPRLIKIRLNCARSTAITNSSCRSKWGCHYNRSAPIFPGLAIDQHTACLAQITYLICLVSFNVYITGGHNFVQYLSTRIRRLDNSGFDLYESFNWHLWHIGTKNTENEHLHGYERKGTNFYSTYWETRLIHRTKYHFYQRDLIYHSSRGVCSW